MTKPWMISSVAVMLSLHMPAVVRAQGPASARLPDGINKQTKDAIDAGLRYLARTQDRDGSWSNKTSYGNYPVAMTSLAGLALLMDGNTTTQGRYAAQVDRATNFILRSTAPSGLIAGRTREGRPMYGHGFSMLYLSQLHGMVEDAERARAIQEVLAGGVQLTARAQSKLGGWFYTPESRADEGSVTVTQVQALRSCRNAGVAVPKAVIDQSMEYLVISQNSDGGIRYTATQHGGTSRPALTPAAVCCWFNAGEYDNPKALKALAYCKDNLDPLSQAHGHRYYAHLYMAQAMYISKDPGWEEYFRKLRDRLLRDQLSEGQWIGDGVGDIYGTSVALIILQLPFNQIPIMQQ
ncbi:MAG: prenyltransferase/squalene oxidase repeat-containing protein [Planctomycetota bacterium]